MDYYTHFLADFKGHNGQCSHPNVLKAKRTPSRITWLRSQMLMTDRKDLSAWEICHSWLVLPGSLAVKTKKQVTALRIEINVFCRSAGARVSDSCTLALRTTAAVMILFCNSCSGTEDFGHSGTGVCCMRRSGSFFNKLTETAAAKELWTDAI